MNLTGKAHVKFNNAALVNHIFSDYANEYMQLLGPQDLAMDYYLQVWTGPHRIRWGSIKSMRQSPARRTRCGAASMNGNADGCIGATESLSTSQTRSQKHSSFSEGIRSEHISTGYYTLDSTTESECMNLSVGKRSLLNVVRRVLLDGEWR
ncbi:hypothetical protein EDB19DRAFT_1947463 [Suillus lakei]|nr:hypothetical protein EDB19DRAFT_1947463 [Suillus lakei]